MKKALLFYLLLCCLGIDANASHITGGELSYTYQGNNRYAFSLKLYMRCNSGRLFNSPAIVSVFNKSTRQRLSDNNILLSFTETISIDEPDPCISNPPFVCYEVGYYLFNLTLPPSASGYIVSSEVNYRIAGISNLQPGSGQVGATYTAEIPGSGAAANNSALFVGSDLVVVCANNRMSYSFAARDEDGDALRYSFCRAYQASNSGGGAAPPLTPPYASVPYANGYSASLPLGPLVQIDPLTGLITGTAPSDGIYVVTVCVEEIRAGTVIATQRKDLQIFIASCNIASAVLEPSYSLCRESFTLAVANLNENPLINAYNWEILNGSGLLLHSSADSALVYNFTDTGTYRIKLLIYTGNGCSDTTSAAVKVYPGFRPDFGVTGFCISRPSVFTDRTSSVYGVPTAWSWDFGESSSTTDFSTQRHPVYTYPLTGEKRVLLTVSNSVGCRDTVSRTVVIFDKPPLSLAFRDTLICVDDQVQLLALGEGNYSWTAAGPIINPLSASPTVSPAITTRYFVRLEQEGCINADSVLVRVVDHVSLAVMEDTLICSGDPLRLRIVSDAFLFNWTPAVQLDDPTLRNPIATTQQTTNYQVTARLGGCTDTKSIWVRTVPYPVSKAGNDTTICYGSEAFLRGLSDGSFFSWSPAGLLDSAGSLNPIANPKGTTHFVLSAYDTRGCPKPGRDTVIVYVLPRIIAFAGADTAVVQGQSLQLYASGGVQYEWSPPHQLSATNIPDPVALFYEGSEGLQYKVMVYNEAGCVDSATINIKVFVTEPSIFVPGAFTPGNDGLNDVLRPVMVGMRQLEYFQIYNRNGQLIFRTNEPGKGWNGHFGGRPQDPATFVWMAKAIDYKGKIYQAKGTFILIR